MHFAAEMPPLPSCYAATRHWLPRRQPPAADYAAAIFDITLIELSPLADADIIFAGDTPPDMPALQRRRSATQRRALFPPLPRLFAIFIYAASLTAISSSSMPY